MAETVEVFSAQIGIKFEEIDQAVNSINALKTSLDGITKTIANFESITSSAVKSISSIGKGAGSFRQAETDINRAAASIREVESAARQLKGDFSQAVGAVRNFSTEFVNSMKQGESRLDYLKRAFKTSFSDLFSSTQNGADFVRMIDEIAAQIGHTTAPKIVGVLRGMNEQAAKEWLKFVQTGTSSGQELFDVMVGHSIIPDMANRIVSTFDSIPNRVNPAFLDLAMQATGTSDVIMGRFSKASEVLYRGAIAADTVGKALQASGYAETQWGSKVATSLAQVSDFMERTSWSADRFKRTVRGAFTELIDPSIIDFYKTLMTYGVETEADVDKMRQGLTKLSAQSQDTLSRSKINVAANRSEYEMLRKTIVNLSGEAERSLKKIEKELQLPTPDTEKIYGFVTEYKNALTEINKVQQQAFESGIKAMSNPAAIRSMVENLRSQAVAAMDIGTLSNQMERFRDASRLGLGSVIDTAVQETTAMTASLGSLFGGTLSERVVSFRHMLFGVGETSNIVAKALDGLRYVMFDESEATKDANVAAELLAGSMAKSNAQIDDAIRLLAQDAKISGGVARSEFSDIEQLSNRLSTEWKNLTAIIQSGSDDWGGRLAQVRQSYKLLQERIDILKSKPILEGEQLAQLEELESALAGNETALVVMTQRFRQAQVEAKAFAHSVFTIEGVLDRLKYYGSQSLLSMFSLITMAFSTGMSAVVGVVRQKAEAVLNVFGWMKDEAVGHSIIPDMIMEIVGWFGRLTGMASSAMGGFANAVLWPFRKVSSAISGLASNLFGQIQMVFDVSSLVWKVQEQVGKVVDSFTSVQTLMQDVGVTLGGMLEGTDITDKKAAIEDFFNFIRSKAKATPFEVSEILAQNMRLFAFQIDPNEWFDPIVNAASAIGKPMEQFVNALAKLSVSSSGAMGEAVMMLADFGINAKLAGGWIDATTGKVLTFQQAMEANAGNVQAGWEKISFAQAQEAQDTNQAMLALQAYLIQDAKFAKAASARSTTLSGIMSNMADAQSELLSVFGQPLWDKITGIFGEIYQDSTNVQSSMAAWLALLGQDLSTVLDNLWGSMKGFFLYDGELPAWLDNLAAVIHQFAEGGWPAAWLQIVSITQEGILGVMTVLSDNLSWAIDYGFSYVDQIAAGIIEGANTVLVEAMNYVGSMIASFTEPGSPPERGPLSTIDSWGRDLMGVYTDSMAQVNTSPIEGALGNIAGLFTAIPGSIQDKIAKARAKVAELKAQIAVKEQEGHVPEYLRQMLELEQKNLDTLVEQAKELKKTSDESETSKSKAVSSESKRGSAARAASSVARDAIKREKESVEDRYTRELSLIEEKKRQGIISEREYAQERLRIEERYYEGVTEEGRTATAENIKNIKLYQAEVDRLKEANKASAEKGGKAGPPLTSKEFLEGAFKGFNEAEATEEFGARIKTAMDKIKVATPESVQRMSNQISGVFNQAVERATGSIQASIQRSATKLGLGDWFSQGALRIPPEVSQSVTDFFGPLTRSITWLNQIGLPTLKGWFDQVYEFFYGSMTGRSGLSLLIDDMITTAEKWLAGAAVGLLAFFPLLDKLSTPVLNVLSSLLSTLYLHFLYLLDAIKNIGPVTRILFGWVDKLAALDFTSLLSFLSKLRTALGLVFTTSTLVFAVVVVGIAKNGDKLISVFNQVTAAASSMVSRWSSLFGGGSLDLDFSGPIQAIQLVLYYLGRLAGAVGDLLDRGLFEAVGKAFGGIIDFVWGAAQEALAGVDIVMGIAGLIMGDWDQAMANFKAGWVSYRQSLQSIAMAFPEMLGAAIQVVPDILLSVWATMSDVMGNFGMADWLRGLRDTLDGLISNFVGDTVTALQGVIRRVFSGANFNLVVEKITQFVTDLNSKLQLGVNLEQGWRRINEAMSRLRESTARLRVLFELLRQAVADRAWQVFQKISSVLAGVIERIKAALPGIQPIITMVKNALKAMGDILQDIFGSLDLGLILWNAFKGTILVVAGVIGGILATALATAVGLITGISRAVETAANGLANAITGIINFGSDLAGIGAGLLTILTGLVNLDSSQIGAGFEQVVTSVVAGFWDLVTVVKGLAAAIFGSSLDLIVGFGQGFFETFVALADTITGSDILARIGDWFAGVWDSLTTQAGQASGGIAQAIMDWIDQVASFDYGGAFNRLIEYLSGPDFQGQVQQAGAKIGGWIGNSIKAVLASPIIGGMIGWDLLTNLWKSITAYFAAPSAEQTTATQKMSDSLVSGLKPLDLGQKIGEFFKGLWLGITAYFSTPSPEQIGAQGVAGAALYRTMIPSDDASPLTLQWGTFFKNAIEKIDWVGNVITPLVDGLRRAFDVIPITIGSFASGVLDGVIAAVFGQDVAAKAQPYLDGLGQTLANGLKLPIDIALTSLIVLLNPVDKFNEMTASWSGNFQNLATIVEYWLGQIGTYFNRLWTDATGYVAGLYTDIIGWFQKVYDDLVGHSIVVDLVDQIVALLASLPQRLLEIGGPIIEAFSNFGNSIVSGMLTGIQNTAGSVGGFLSGLFGGGGEAESGGQTQAAPAGDPMAGLGQILNPTAQLATMNQAWSEAFITVKTTVTDTLESIGEDTSVWVINFNDTLERFRQMTVGEGGIFPTIIASIGDAIRSTNWNEVGSSIISGIIKGIKDNQRKVYELLKKVAQQSVKAASDELGIHSPSLAFMELGVQTVEGFVKGIDSMVPSATSIVHDMGQEIDHALDDTTNPDKISWARNLYKAYAQQIWDLEEAGKLTQKSLKELFTVSWRRSGMSDAQIKTFLDTIVDKVDKVKKLHVGQFLVSQFQAADKQFEVSQETVSKFEERLGDIKKRALLGRRALESMMGTRITREDLSSMFAVIQRGGTYGQEIDNAVRDAVLAQNELNSALEEQGKIQKANLDITEKYQKLEFLQSQLGIFDKIEEYGLVGSEILEGLKLGMDATASDVMTAIDRVLSGILEKTQQALDIHSPSGEFEWLGQMITKGLGLGITGGQAGLLSDISGVVGNLTTAMATGGAIANATTLAPAMATRGGDTYAPQFNTQIYDAMYGRQFEQRVEQIISRKIK